MFGNLHTPILKHTKNLLGVMFLCTALFGCAETEKDKYVERSVYDLYQEAYGLMESDPKKAAKTFEEVERQHPYSVWAPKADILAAYSYYLAQKYDDATSLLETFLQVHPSHGEVPYVYYLLGLCYYEQISTVERDQEMTELALKTFNELLKRFPTSVYAKDALLKIDLASDHMAGREMSIGRFYLKNHQPTAAINRFNTVVEKYQTTTHAAEALYRLVECYKIVGLTHEAQRVAGVLGYNYPQSIWYHDAYRLLSNKAVLAKP